MKLSIVTLNYCKPELTLRCVASVHEIFKQELKEGVMEVIIVDNKSPDNSLEVIRNKIEDKKYKNITLFPNTENEEGNFSFEQIRLQTPP